MRYKGRRKSTNVEDRRGIPAKGKLAGGGIVGILVVVGIVLLQGGDLGNVLQALLQQSSQVAGPSPGHTPTAEENELADFVSVVLADTEDIWNEQFRQAGLTYKEPQLVFFSDQVQSACGLADSGPSTAARTRRSTSTCASTNSSNATSAPRATSRRPTSSRTRSATTSSTCWATPNGSTARADG